MYQTTYFTTITSKQQRMLEHLNAMGARFVLSIHCNMHVVYSEETVQQRIATGWVEITGEEYMERLNG